MLTVNVNPSICMAWEGPVSSSSVKWLYIPRPFPPTPLCCLLLYLAEGFILHVLWRLHKYHRICNAFTKLPTIKPGTSLKKCDSQDFYISNHMQNKLVYLASLAYGMEILYQSLCGIFKSLGHFKGFQPFCNGIKWIKLLYLRRVLSECLYCSQFSNPSCLFRW